VTKADITESIVEKAGFSRRDAAEIVDLVFETIKEALGRGDKIKIYGFGNFVTRQKKSRVRRSPALAATRRPASPSTSPPAARSRSSAASC